MTTYTSTILPIQSTPYVNLSMDEGFNSTFEVAVTDGTTGLPMNLTGCSVVMSVCYSSLLSAIFVLSTIAGTIPATDATGIISVSVPGSNLVGLTGVNLQYDIVVTDPLLVSLSVLRGILTVNQVA